MVWPRGIDATLNDIGAVGDQNWVLEKIVGGAVLLEDDDDVLDLPPLGDGAGRIATAPIHIEQESACRKHQTRGIQECGMAHA